MVIDSVTTSRFAVILALSIAMSSGHGCNAEDALDRFEEELVTTPKREEYTGPRKRTARAATVRCFASFPKFKRAMKKTHQKSSKRDVNEWHHIVGQHPHNKKKFKPKDFDAQYDHGIRILEKLEISWTLLE